MDKVRKVLAYRLVLVLGLLLVLALPGAAAAGEDTFPATIPLPVGFAPEGIAVGRGTTFYTGSLSAMGIYRGDLRTGQGAILTAPAGRVHVGMKVDVRSNILFVAGGPTGQAYIYNADTGAQLAVLQLAPPGTTFINDVVVTRDAVYFTGSFQPFFYRLPLGPAGELPSPLGAQTIPLTGQWQQGTGFGANGIVATPNGEYLIIVNSTLGLLFRVDPLTGYATQINLGGASVTAGDGLWLAGKTLYVVRNALNQVAVFNLAPDFLSATLVGTVTNPALAVPTTIAGFGSSLYAVNAKFGTPSAGTSYQAVKLSR